MDLFDLEQNDIGQIDLGRFDLRPFAKFIKCWLVVNSQLQQSQDRVVMEIGDRYPISLFGNQQ